MFGHCLDRQHKDCKGSFERFYFGPVGKGRKKVQGVIYTGETTTCDCTCHRKDKNGQAV